MVVRGSVAGMGTAAETLAVVDWRRRVNKLYEEVRAAEEPATAWKQWREGRDELLRMHPQSPLPPEARRTFAGIDYYEYDPDCRVVAELADAEAEPQPIETSGVQPMLFRRFAHASFELYGELLQLEIYWLEGYAGGAFLPFRDATSGHETYGGGRYVLDTVKGADLGTVDGGLVLDFNFAYNPSCSYDPGWVCPLAPPANRLAVAVRAGELYL